jgi:hypothetical protein
MTLCEKCNLPHEGTPGWEPCIAAQAAAMKALLANIADASVCRGCGWGIEWVTHRNGKQTPYDPSGLNHFVSCPKAKDFKRAKD